MNQALMQHAPDEPVAAESETTVVETRSPGELSALISNLSHGLRTPLNPVLGFIELLLETELDATQREYLEQAHGGVLDIDRLLTNLTARIHSPDRPTLRSASGDRSGSSRVSFLKPSTES